MKSLQYYLAYGDIIPFKKSTPVKVYDYNWEDAINNFKTRLQLSLLNIESKHLSYCGTLPGIVMKEILGEPILWTFDSIDVREPTNYTRFSPDNMEKDLITINEMTDDPRCSLEDLFAYYRQSTMKNKGVKTVYCEGGSDYLLLGFNAIMPVLKYLTINKQYSLATAMSVFNRKATSELFEGINLPTYKHSETFYSRFSYFSDSEIKEFGYPSPIIKIDIDTQSKFMTSLFDFGYHIVYERRTKFFGNHFGLKIYSPFYNDPEFVKFCLSLPMEFKYCLGRKKHILKEAYKTNSLVHNYEEKLFNHIMANTKTLTQKYLTDKSRPIFKYLPYDIVQKHLFPISMKTLILLNLAVWMEVNK